MISFSKFILESKSDIIFSFSKNHKDYSFSGKSKKEVYCKVLDWLFNNGYNFSKEKLEGTILNLDKIKSIISKTNYRKDHFYNISNSNNFIKILSPGTGYLDKGGMIYNILLNFGCEQLKLSKSVTDEEVTLPPSEFIEKKEYIEYSENPFKQSICVLGDPGVGKSVTIRNILRNENHIFQIIEPTATTTGLLSQFSPSKHEYVPSRIGKLLIESSTNPNNLYTVVIDEFHKSNVIEMVNDELKHAISLKRYSGDRFILIDDATEYLKEYLEEDDGGNAMVPDNFGFIFISSKPRVISNNRDIFDRLDVVILKEENRSINSSEELLNLKISEEEKKKLSSSRND